MARFDEGPYSGREPGGAPRRPESLSDYAARPPAGPGPAHPAPDQGGPAAGDFPSAAPPAISEPTQPLPTVKPLKVAAQAVIVYQEAVRRPWRLWAFTSVLVALTAGVILGQTVAFEPTYRSGANAQAAVVPETPSPVPSPSGSSAPLSPAWPDAAHRATAPLGTTKARVLEVVGSSTVLNVRSADLGKNLYDIATLDRSAVPQLTSTARAATLRLIPTGDSGTVGAQILLNSKVAWTLRIAGGRTTQTIDMQAGGVAGLQLTGGSAHTALLLPAPRGTVPLSVGGPIADLTVSTKTSTPLRITLDGGATSAAVNGTTRRAVKPGTTLTPTGWTKTRNRYDLTTTGKITGLLATTSAPKASPSPSGSPSAR